MINKKISVGIAAMCAAAILGSIDASPGAAVSKNEDPNTMARIAQELNTIRDIADVPTPERQRILKAIGVRVPSALTSCAAGLESYTTDILACVDWLTSSDFGDRQSQDALCQCMILDCLSVANKISLQCEFRLVGQLRLGSARSLNASGQKVAGKEWQGLRNHLAECRLHLWRRIETVIEPNWDPNDVPMINVQVSGVTPYSAGVAPESIKEPEIRKRYEAVLEANRQKNEKYREQRSARDIRQRYLPRLKGGIADLYKMGPTSQDDLDMLKACLRIYVPEEKLRNELFEIAQRAAKQSPPATTSVESPQ